MYICLAVDVAFIYCPWYPDTPLARRRVRVKGQYGSDLCTPEESAESYTYIDGDHEQTAPLLSKGKATIDDATAQVIAAAVLPKELGTTGGVLELQVQSTSAEPIPAADVAETVLSRDLDREVLPGAPTVATSTRAYDARFAYPAVCVCAEHGAVQDAVQRLVGAVRETAALLTRLHSEEPLQRQCALLGRMFEFDCFLW